MADVTTIDRALDAFMDAKNWGETRTVLEERRDLLLSMEAIERLVFRASLRKNERQRTSMALHARLLLRARDEGIAAAWAWLEDRLVRQQRIETQVEELSQGPEAEMAERLQRMVASFSPTDMQIFQEELEKAEPAPASGAGAGGAAPSRGGVAEAVAEYLGTNSWPDALDLLRERRETLLTADAERLLREAATRAERAGSHDAARAFTRHAEVLRIARDQGFEAARAYTATSASGGAPMAMAGPATPPVVRTRGPVTPPQKHTGELFPPTDDANGGSAGMTRISTLRPRAPTDEERAAAMALLAMPNLLDANTARAVRAWLELPGYTATPEEIALMRLELREAMK